MPFASSACGGATGLESLIAAKPMQAWLNAPRSMTSTHAAIDTATAAAPPLSIAGDGCRVAIRNGCSVFSDDFQA